MARPSPHRAAPTGTAPHREERAPLTTAFLAPDDPRWRAVLARVPHDVYHLPEYVVPFARAGGGEALAFYAEAAGQACLVPFVARPVPDRAGGRSGVRDLVSPYGYSPPLFTHADDALGLTRMVAALREAGAARGMLTAVCRMHPFLPVPGPLRALGALATHGPLAYIDLRHGPEAVWHGVRSRHRVDLLALHREGFRARLDDWSQLGAFARAYAHTMARVGADAAFRFEEGFFGALHERLGRRLHLASVHAPGGAFAAGLLFTTTGPFANAFLSATAPGHRKPAPSKLAYLEAALHARARGAETLLLGGGLGSRRDSIFYFKSGFSADTRPFQTFRLVLDAPAFAAACRRAGVAAAPPGDADAYFPPYRRPA